MSEQHREFDVGPDHEDGFEETTYLGRVVNVPLGHGSDGTHRHGASRRGDVYLITEREVNTDTMAL